MKKGTTWTVILLDGGRAVLHTPENLSPEMARTVTDLWDLWWSGRGNSRAPALLMGYPVVVDDRRTNLPRPPYFFPDEPGL